MCAQRTLPVLRQGQDSRHPARYVLLLAMSETSGARCLLDWPTAPLTALCGSELGEGDVLVAAMKQDCIGSSNSRSTAMLAAEIRPLYAYCGSAGVDPVVTAGAALLK